MAERRMLNTWKEIAAYLSRGVRTVQRWEANYNLPVRRPANDASSVYAFSDEIDAWLERSRPESVPYVRPTVLILDVITPSALSELKLSVELAKYNVLTAFTAAEVLATAARYDVDAIIIDSVVLDADPSQLGKELQARYPRKLRVLVGDESPDSFDHRVASGNPRAIVELLIDKLGPAEITHHRRS